MSQRFPTNYPRQFKDSDDLCRYVAGFSDTVILGFSAGKDSVASWLQVRRHFKRVVAFYLYYVPGISFIEDNLRYYEDFFGQPILRYPHPVLWEWLRTSSFQPPERVEAVKPLRLSYGYTAGHVLVDLDKFHDTKFALSAEGVKMSDSLQRRIMIRKHGALYPDKRRFYCAYDWTNDRMEREIRDAGVKLSSEYNYFKRTWEGVALEQIVPLKKHFPADYERVREWLPLLDVMLWRQKFYEEEKAYGNQATAHPTAR